MRKNILPFIFLFLTFNSYAQVGFKPDYAILQAPGWKDIIQLNTPSHQAVYVDAIGFINQHINGKAIFGRIIFFLEPLLVCNSL